MAKITTNDLKMAYLDPFWPIFDPVTYEFYVFLCKTARKPNFDHPEGQKLDFTLKFTIFSSKMANITLNDLKMAYFDPFWPIFDPVTYYVNALCKMARET